MKTHKIHFRLKNRIRHNKSEMIRFRVDLMRKKAWVEGMEALGIKDFSSYARQAIDGAIDRDFRAKDPKWQEFLKAVKDISIKILGYQLVDNPSLRNQDLTETENIFFKRGQELARARGITQTKELPTPEKKTIRFSGRRPVVIRHAHAAKA